MTIYKTNNQTNNISKANRIYKTFRQTKIFKTKHNKISKTNNLIKMYNNTSQKKNPEKKAQKFRKFP